MAMGQNTITEYNTDQNSQSSREILSDQLFWLIKLRWVAVISIVSAAIIGKYVFPALITTLPLYICAAILMFCNVTYYFVAIKRSGGSTQGNIVWAMIQVEIDMVVLTTLLHFSGGVMNPFVLFYVFHVIMAAIILSRTLAFSVGLSAICLYGLLAVGELQGWFWLKHYPLQLASAGALWSNPVYVLWVFVAFVVMVILAQYLTRTIIARIKAKEREVARINEMLQLSQIEMAQREKMVALGQMASGIAHEIGNPLNCLSSIVQYLSRKSCAPETKEQYNIINEQIMRISKILKNMLSLARPASNEFTWLDINKVIDESIALVKYDKRAHKVNIKNTPNNQLPTIWIKKQNIEQVLLNVFINALDAMDCQPDENEHVLEITKEINDDMIEIRICDTGIGMPDEVSRRAFEPFFSTKESNKGTGLGLYISLNLVKEVGGTIELKKNPVSGTTVIIQLPVNPSKELVTPKHKSKTPVKV